MEIRGDNPLEFLQRQTHSVLQFGRKVKRMIPGQAAETAPAGAEEEKGGFLTKYGLWIAAGVGAFLFFGRRRA